MKKTREWRESFWLQVFLWLSVSESGMMSGQESRSFASIERAAFALPKAGFRYALRRSCVCCNASRSDSWASFLPGL